MAKLNVKNLGKRAVTGLTAAGGGAASIIVTKKLPFVDKIDPKLLAAGKILIGGILPEVSPKNKWLEPFGMGFAGHAGSELAQALMPTFLAGVDNPVSGMGSDRQFVIDEDAEPLMHGTKKEEQGRVHESSVNGVVVD